MKRDHSIHVRVSDECDDALALMAQLKGSEKAALVAEIVERAVMGEMHGLKVAAQRMVRLGFVGISGEREG